MAIDPDKRAEWKEIFHSMDIDGNGTINFREFCAFMRRIDPEVTDAELEVGFDIVDDNDNRRITFKEFIEWWDER